MSSGSRNSACNRSRSQVENRQGWGLRATRRDAGQAPSGKDSVSAPGTAIADCILSLMRCRRGKITTSKTAVRIYFVKLSTRQKS